MSGHADEYALFNDVLGRVQSERDALLAENQRLREALERIAADADFNCEGECGPAAREALRSEQPLTDPTNREWRGTPKAWRSEQ